MSSAWRVERGIVPEASLLVVTARLHPVKGHALLIDALRQITPARPWHVAFVGREDGVTRASLVARAAGSWLESRLHLVDELDDVRPALDAATLVALPSRWGESFPNTVVEALAHETPVIASALGDTAAISAASIAPGPLPTSGAPNSPAPSIRSSEAVIQSRTSSSSS